MAANGFSLIFFLKFSLSINLRSFMIENMLLYYLPFLSKDAPIVFTFSFPLYMFLAQ